MFAIQYNTRNDHEGQTVVTHCILNRIPYRITKEAKIEPHETPVGTVKWVEDVLGAPVRPDYYPEFLSPWLHRKVWPAEKWPLSKMFIKPADRHKRFTGFVTSGTWRGKKRGPYWCSEIVTFVSEWRFYVANGKVLAAHWGSGEEMPVPEIAVDWPADFCGAVDFGLLNDGKIALIESNAPFACGWYGATMEGKVYCDWLAAGWQHIQSLRKVNQESPEIVLKTNRPMKSGMAGSGVSLPPLYA